MRLAVAASAALLLLASLIVVSGSSARPDSHNCAKEMQEDACAAAVEAVLRRGLPGLHPLITATFVEPGPAPEATQLGHRATVRFQMLGLPGTTTIELWYDQGGHWGGSSDRDDAEVVAWTLAPLLVAGLLTTGIVGLAWRRRSRRTTA